MMTRCYIKKKKEIGGMFFMDWGKQRDMKKNDNEKEINEGRKFIY